jgi:hypothetical protein
MKDKFNKIKFKLEKLLTSHQAFVVVCLFLTLFSVMVYRLTVLSNIQPDQAYIDEQKLSIKTFEFKQADIDKIKALRDSNVKDPGTDIQKNRQNPFAE